ncbi:hypothetical protein [Salipaludibacillus neizhouensis]|nr:hypothetical protein [Salipaludibacillus neizhouensis]
MYKKIKKKGMREIDSAQELGMSVTGLARWRKEWGIYKYRKKGDWR